MKRVELTYANRGYNNKVVDFKESNKAKDLYDFVDEHSFELFPSDALEEFVVHALMYIKDNNAELYSKYKDDIDGIINVYEAMDYQSTISNDEFENKIFDILTNNIEDFLDYHDDLTDEVMGLLTGFDIGINYISDDEYADKYEDDNE